MLFEEILEAWKIEAFQVSPIVRITNPGYNTMSFIVCKKTEDSRSETFRFVSNENTEHCCISLVTWALKHTSKLLLQG